MNWQFGVGRALIFFSLYLLSVFAHETGHMVAYRYITKRRPIIKHVRPKMFLREFLMKLPEDISKEQKIVIIAAGVVGGFVPIALLSSALFMYEFILLIILYYWGARHDVKLWWKLWKEE